MRRPLNLFMVLASVLGVALTAEAGAEEEWRKTVGEANHERSSVIVSNPGGTDPGEPPVRSARRGPPQPRAGQLVTLYHVRFPADGEPCLYSVTTRREAPLTKDEEFRNENLTGYAATFGMPTCDSGNDAVPARLASAFVRTIPLPTPRPHIAPGGTSITGLPAYLETNGNLVHQVAPTDTPLGAITVEARSTYWVDWGDGTSEAGPFDFEGEAYPSGRITHNYQYTGSYTVTVRQAWTANWRLGTDSGTVDGLETRASIPLEVGELQAVIQGRRPGSPPG